MIAWKGANLPKSESSKARTDPVEMADFAFTFCLKWFRLFEPVSCGPDFCVPWVSEAR